MLIFRKKLAMRKEADFIEEWMEEARTKTAQRALAQVLTSRFGSLSPDVMARLEELSEEQCMELLGRVAAVSSLAELGF